MIRLTISVSDALGSTSAPGEAMALLQQAHQSTPVLTVLVSIARDKDDFAVALRYALELATLAPENALLRALVADLEQKARQSVAANGARRCSGRGGQDLDRARPLRGC